MDADPAVASAPGACAGGAAVTVIAPARSGLGVDLAELWRYRELLYFLAWRDLKARYKQTVFGVGWAIVRPVLTMVVFSIVFGGMMGVRSQGAPYPIFLYAGLLPWMLFSGSVSQAGVSLVNQVGLFTKVYFPRVFIPASSIVVVMVDTLLAAGVYCLLMAWYGHLPGPSILLVPVLVAITLMLSLGLGLWLASLTVTYRDFRTIVPFLMQTWMFLTPVMWPPQLASERHRWLLSLNPMTGVVCGFRSCLLNRPIDWISLAASAAIAMVYGLHYFGRTERRFADIA